MPAHWICAQHFDKSKRRALSRYAPDVLILTESRTAFDYLLSPITASLARVFREQ